MQTYHQQSDIEEVGPGYTFIFSPTMEHKR